MRQSPLLGVALAAAALPAAAIAQAPDATPPSVVLQVSTTTQSLDSMIDNGLVFNSDQSENLTYTAKVAVTLKDAAGTKATVKKVVKLKKRY